MSDVSKLQKLSIQEGRQGGEEKRDRQGVIMNFKNVMFPLNLTTHFIKAVA